MKLSRLDQRILRFIRDSYPIPYNPSEDYDLAMGERPLVDEQELCTVFKGVSAEDVKASVRNLVAYQCIAKVYLLSEGEYADQWAHGRTIRHTVLAEKGGVDCYQITAFGENVLEGLPWERAKRASSTLLSRSIEGYIQMLVAFLLGMLLSSIFGFDITQLRQ